MSDEKDSRPEETPQERPEEKPDENTAEQVDEKQPAEKPFAEEELDELQDLIDIDKLPEQALDTDIAAIFGGSDFDAVMESIPEVPLGAVDPQIAPFSAELDSIPEPLPMQSREELERERMNLLVSHFDEQQMARYAAFRRANIRRAAVKRYASQLLNQPISNNVAVVLAGMSKVLVGDIIELARDLQERDLFRERSQQGVPQAEKPEPLLPTYVREAWRLYKEEQGTVPGSKLRPGAAGRLF